MMIPFQRNICLILTLFFFTKLIGQQRNTVEVPFDLDKRSIGELPFDESFKLSGFSTRYDKIILTYYLDKEDCKWCYNRGDTLELEIDKLTNTAYPTLIKPLHPNLKYKFDFRVWKKIDLSDDEIKLFQEDVYKIIKRDFSDPEKLTSNVKNNFKRDLQNVLIKYAKTDKIVDKQLQKLDITNSKLYMTDISAIITEFEDKYEDINKKSNSNSTISLKSLMDIELSNKLNSYRFKTIHKKILKALKNDKTNSSTFRFLLDSPINISLSPNNNLTLRQYLEYLRINPTSKIYNIIEGKQKVIGADHVASNKIDLISLQLLFKVFEKLKRQSVTDNRRARVFNNYEVQFLTDLKNNLSDYIKYIETLNQYQSDIINIKSKIPNLLKDAFIAEDILISNTIEIDALSEKNAYIGLDAGLGYSFGAFNSVFIYQGANIYLRPVNHQTKFSELQGWDEFLKRFSFYLGLSQVLTEKQDRFEPLFGSSNLLLGVGYRFHRGIRLNIGTMLHYKKDKIITVDDKKINFSPTMSISFDLNIAKALGSVGGILNLK